MTRSSTPAEIREASTNYRTEQLREAGKEILEKWDGDMTFQKLAEQGEWSAGHYSNAYYENMGPVDDPKERTFDQIKDTYGSLKNYYEKRSVVESEFRDEEEDIDFEGLLRNDLSERDIFMIRQGYKLAKTEEEQLPAESKIVE